MQGFVRQTDRENVLKALVLFLRSSNDEDLE